MTGIWILVTVVGAVLEVGKASDAELAAFVTPLHAALEECVGIMAADRLSYQSVNPSWTPELADAGTGRFGMPELIRFALG